MPGEVGILGDVQGVKDRALISPFPPSQEGDVRALLYLLNPITSSERRMERCGRIGDEVE